MPFGCGHCDFKTKIGTELSEHIKNFNNSVSEVSSCNKCNYKTAVRGRMESHMVAKHSQITALCKFFLEGKCTRSACSFRHEKSETINHKSNKIFNRGQTCYFKSINKCHFLHPEEEVHKVQNYRQKQVRVK